MTWEAALPTAPAAPVVVAFVVVAVVAFAVVALVSGRRASPTEAARAAVVAAAEQADEWAAAGRYEPAPGTPRALAVAHLDGTAYVDAPTPPPGHAHHAQTRATHPLTGARLLWCPCGASTSTLDSTWTRVTPDGTEVPA